MAKVKLNYPERTVIVTPATFGIKIAKVIDKFKSSHMFFVMQQAYGDIGWEECQKILNAVLNKK